jgi:hypothetical protein
MELAPAPGAAVGFREGERVAVDEQVLHGSLRRVAGDSIATDHAWTRGESEALRGQLGRQGFAASKHLDSIASDHSFDAVLLIEVIEP